jgi:hypothetical protein
MAMAAASLGGAVWSVPERAATEGDGDEEEAVDIG